MARAPNRIAPIETLRDKAYQNLRGDIRAGLFAPGERLVELDLADHYGVSRTPIREALLQLAREGLIAKAGRSFVVPVDSRQVIMDRLAVRELFDVAIVRALAEKADEACIAGLEHVYNKASRAHKGNRAKTFATAQQEFRQLLRDNCGNAVLAHHSEMVDDSFQQARAHLYEDERNREVTLAGDRTLIDAIIRKDPDAAEAQTRRFLNRVRSFYRTGES